MAQQYPADLQEAIRFHGHVCPGLVLGYRAARAACDVLGAERPNDEELVAIVESDGCGVDAIQALLGCTLGKGNLIFRDHGKQVYTIISRRRHRAVRIAMKGDLLQRSPEEEALFQKAARGEASAGEHEAFRRWQLERVEQLLAADAGALLEIAEVSPQVPEKARIFKSQRCTRCGEMVMEPRARIREGQVVCIPCSESYARGWGNTTG